MIFETLALPGIGDYRLVNVGNSIICITYVAEEIRKSVLALAAQFTV